MKTLSVFNETLGIFMKTLGYLRKTMWKHYEFLQKPSENTRGFY